MRILFIGSVPDHIPGTDQTIAPEHQPLFEAASELGYAAVLRGHTILLGSESPRTIDFYVMRGILNACATKPDQEFFVEIHRPEGTAAPYPSVPKNLKVSRISYEQDSKAEFRWMVAHVLALDSSDVCIAIGGGASTRVIGYIGAERQKAILAIASFGGSAKILWEKLKFVYKNHFYEGAAGRWLHNNLERASCNRDHRIGRDFWTTENPGSATHLFRQLFLEGRRAGRSHRSCASSVQSNCSAG